MTFSASANPIVYQGATPVFVDSENETWNLCPETLEKAIKDRISKGKKPKAIIDADVDFIDAIGLKEHLSPTRANGLVSMIKQLKMYAIAYQLKV